MTNQTPDDTLEFLPDDDMTASTPVTDDPRTEARLCAIQAVYTQRLAPDAHLAFTDSLLQARGADLNLYQTLTDYYLAHTERLEIFVGRFINEKWTFARLEAGLQALLLVAAAEMFSRPDQSVGTLTSEYVVLGKVLVSASDVPFINAAVEKMFAASRL